MTRCRLSLYAHFANESDSFLFFSQFEFFFDSFFRIQFFFRFKFFFRLQFSNLIFFSIPFLSIPFCVFDSILSIQIFFDPKWVLRVFVALNALRLP